MKNYKFICIVLNLLKAVHFAKTKPNWFLEGARLKKKCLF